MRWRHPRARVCADEGRDFDEIFHLRGRREEEEGLTCLLNSSGVDEFCVRE